MNCNLTNEDRNNGMKCRSWDCQPCKEYVSEHDNKIIESHIVQLKKRATAWDDLKQENEKLKAENEELKRTLEGYKTRVRLTGQDKESEQQLKEGKGVLASYQFAADGKTLEM